MHDAFLSYSQKDLAIAKRIISHLEDAGLDVFWDRNIPIGKTWEKYIEKHLSESLCVVVLWSSNSVDSDWVRAEAVEGVGRGVLIPVAIDRTPHPIRFRSIQAANLVGWDGSRQHEGLDEVIAAVRSFHCVEIPPVLEPKLAKSRRSSSEAVAVAEVETGPSRGRSIILTEATTSATIGRSTDCDFVLDEAYVSRSHCRLVVNPSEPGSLSQNQFTFSLVDSGGPGTLVNGELIHHSKELRNGDRFQIGGVRFIFRVLEND
jgi:hypothetical protein